MSPRYTASAALLLACAFSLSSQSPGWEQLFNGKNLEGWEHVGKGRFVVEDGLLKTEGGMGLLWYTRKKIGNARLRVVYRPGKKTDNSGVFVRIPEPPTEPWMPVHRGYEVQIDDSADEYHATGVLYSLTRATVQAGKTNHWNVLEITLDGPRTVVQVNGILVTDFSEGQPVPPKQQRWEPDRGPRPLEGYIGLQNHGSGDVVYFKQIAVQPLVRRSED